MQNSNRREQVQMKESQQAQVKESPLGAYVRDHIMRSGTSVVPGIIIALELNKQGQYMRTCYASAPALRDRTPRHRQQGNGPVPASTEEQTDPEGHSAESMYLVISPGKHITASLLLVSHCESRNVSEPGGQAQSLPQVKVLATMFEQSAFTYQNMPSVRRARIFGEAVVSAVQTALLRSALTTGTGTGVNKLEAILVRAPPPAEMMRSAAHVQENTWFEAFTIGTVFGHFPHTPIWYVNPADVRESIFPGRQFDGWKDEELASMEISELVAPASASTTFCKRGSARHGRGALCVTVALHHFMRRAHLNSSTSTRAAGSESHTHIH